MNKIKKYAMVIVSAVMLIMAAAPAYAGGTKLNIAAVCYHSVTDNPLNLSTYRISDDEFRADMEYYTSQGYTFMKPCEMWYASPYNKNMVLTFDDGYDDFYDVVFPILKQYNAKAAVYVIGSEIDKTGYLKSWQIKEMDQSGFVEIGNHTNAIHNYGFKSENYMNDISLLNLFIEDVKDCSSKVYSILGHGTESLAYPSGQYTERMDKILKTNLGYNTTFTTDYGIVKTQADIVRPMKRIYRIHGDTPQRIQEMINEVCK